MNRVSYIRLISLALLWGSSFLWIKLALNGLSPIQITFARLAIGATVLVLVIRIRKCTFPSDIRSWLHLATAAVLANIIPYTLFAIGEQDVDSSVAGAMNATAPLWTLLIGVTVKLDQRISRRQICGLIIGFVGALIILTPWTAATNAFWGTVTCLAAALSYGLAYVYQGRFLTNRDLSPLVLSASQLIAAATLMSITIPIAGLQTPHLTLTVVVSVTILGALGTGIAYVLNYRLITDDGPTIASTVSYLLPGASVTLGIIVLGEPATWSLLIGTITVIAGLLLSRHKPGLVKQTAHSS